MSIVECPHCLVSVLPERDARCPSCAKDTRATLESNDTRCALTPGMTLPAMCCRCTEPTERVDRLGLVDFNRDPAWVRLLPSILHPFKLLLRSVELAAEERYVFSVCVPHCSSCAKQAHLSAAHVDAVHHAVTLVVHRAFRDAVRSLNESR